MYLKIHEASNICFLTVATSGEQFVSTLRAALCAVVSYSMALI